MTNKTTEALKLAEEALEELHYSSGTVKAVTLYKSALAAIREALADHSGEANEMVAKPVTISCDCGDIYERNSFGGKFIQQYGCCPNCDAAEPVKQETPYCKCAPMCANPCGDASCIEPMQEPVAKNEGGRITWLVDNWPQNCLLYAAPVDAKAIRAEALEEAAKWLAESGLIGSNDCAAAIRKLK